jgi:hypothetical protein
MPALASAKGDLMIDDIDVDPKAFIPNVNGKKAIWIFVPQNGGLSEHINDFRAALVTAVESKFEVEMDKSSHGAEIAVLTVELEERLRIHSPRATAVDWNLAQVRKMKIESRQQKLNNYFHTLAAKFNHGIQALSAELGRLLDAQIAHAESFIHFQKDLGTVATLVDSGLVKQQYDTEHRTFRLQLESSVNAQIGKINEFATAFELSNQRFFSTLEPSLSPEENAISETAREKLDQQIRSVISSLLSKESAARVAIEERFKKLADEFQMILPHHEADLRLIERVSLLLNDLDRRYAAMIFRSNQNHLDLKRIVARIESVRKCELDHESSIVAQFEALDEARIAIINRAKFLNVLTNGIPDEPKKLARGFLRAEGQGAAMQLQTRPDAPLDRKKQRAVSRQAVAKRKPVAKVAKEIPVKVFENSLRAQVDALSAELTAKAAQFAAEYYNALKTRKFAITRPDAIPPTANEFIERVKSRWRAIIQELPTKTARAAEELRTILFEANASSKLSIGSMCGHFTAFHEELGNEQRVAVTEPFRNAHSELLQLRDRHRRLFTPYLSDENNREKWRTAQSNEHERTIAETKLLQEHRIAMFEFEVSRSRFVVGKLHEFAAIMLDLFDGYVFPEDIVCRPPPLDSEPRATLHELLKEQYRKKQNPELAQGRAFWLRAWPGLELLMPTAEALSQTLIRENTNPAAATANTSPNKGRSRSPKRKTAVVVAAEPTAALAPSSLETGLHRSMIIERDRCYRQFEGRLKERMDEFERAIQEMTDGCGKFTEHWNACGQTLGLPQAEETKHAATE